MSEVNQNTVADFCFPAGVPLCALEEKYAKAAAGKLMSKWDIASVVKDEQVGGNVDGKFIFLYDRRSVIRFD